MDFIKKILTALGLRAEYASTEEVLTQLEGEVHAALADAKALVDHAKDIAAAHEASAKNIIDHYTQGIKDELARLSSVKALADDIALGAHFLSTINHPNPKLPDPTPAPAPETTPAEPTPAG